MCRKIIEIRAVEEAWDFKNKKYFSLICYYFIGKFHEFYDFNVFKVTTFHRALWYTKK